MRSITMRRRRFRHRLLEEVFELNEEPDSVRELRASGLPMSSGAPARSGSGTDRQEEGRARVALAGHLHAVGRAAEDDEAGRSRVLRMLRDRVPERNYITNLFANGTPSGAGGPQL